MLSINISEVVWTVINFFLLLFLLKRFLYTPIINFMDARNARIAEAMKAEREAQSAVERNELLLSENRDRSRSDAKRIIAEAKAEDERLRGELVAKAKADEAANRKEMKLSVGREQETLEGELSQSEPELAAILANRLLTEEDDAPRVRANAGMPVCSRDRNWADAEPYAGKTAPDETERILSRARAMDKRRVLAGAADTGMADTVVRLRDDVEDEMKAQEMELAILLAEKILGKTEE